MKIERNSKLLRIGGRDQFRRDFLKLYSVSREKIIPKLSF